MGITDLTADDADQSSIGSEEEVVLNTLEFNYRSFHLVSEYIFMVVNGSRRRR